MGWNKITIDTLTSAEDMISYELTELGEILFLQIYDRRRDESHVCGSIAR